jgi:hypothetical protein
MRLRQFVLLLAAALLAAAPVLAQTTGSMSGFVLDTEGAPLPGATVTIAGPQLPLGRSTTTLADGSFQFLGLIPGEYNVKAELTNLGVYEQKAVVVLSKDTQVRAVLRPTATEAVEVTAALPLVDTKSTALSDTTPREMIEKLPLARTFTGTFQLAPGAVDTGLQITPTSVGINAGGGRQDNTFLYDGVNVTNPFFGDSYQDFAELDIQEVNITRGGISAEFGRTGGFLINGVTRSGTNDYHGEARVEYQPDGLSAHSKDPTLDRRFEKIRPGGGLGGRIIQDRLFFYASANFFRQDEVDRVDNTGPLPDSEFNQDELFGKLTFNPTTSLLFDGSYRWRNGNITNDGTTSRETGTVASDVDIKDRVAVFSALWTPNSRWTLEGKFNYNQNKNDANPVLDFGYLPTPFNAADASTMGRFDDGTTVSGSDDFFQTNDFSRTEFRFQSSYLLNGFGATHDVRAGVSYSGNREELDRIANGWGSIILSTSSSCGPADQRPCYRARYWLDQPAQISEGRTWGIFLQDRITWRRLTLNVGVLMNQDEFIPNDGGQFDILRGDYTIPNAQIPTCADAPGAATCTYRDTVTFGFLDQVQPRVGAAFIPSEKVGDKIYATFGRYSNMDNQSFARSAAPIRPFRVDAFLNPFTGALVTESIRSNQTNKRVLENIDPTRTDEVTLGYARPIAGVWSAEIWGMYRYTDNIIEDFPGVNRETASGFRYGNIPGWRKYRAVTLEVKKAFRDNWAMDVSYTLSKLEGNWDLDYATQLFYTSSYIADGPGLYVEDPTRTGLLIGDRPSILKVFGTYQFPTDTTAGAYFRYQSGRPYEARGFDVLYGTDYLYLEPAGSRRTESWANLDLLVAQGFRLGPGRIELALTLSNVFNSQPALTVNQDVCLIGPCTAIPPAGDSNRNPNFERPTLYAQPRRLSFALTYAF